MSAHLSFFPLLPSAVDRELWKLHVTLDLLLWAAILGFPVHHPRDCTGKLKYTVND